MKRIFFSLAACALTLVGGGAAHAQNRTVISNSGNGANNTIAVRNVSPTDYLGGGGYNKTIIRDSGNGVGNTIRVGNGGGQGYAPGYQQFAPQQYAPQYDNGYGNGGFVNGNGFGGPVGGYPVGYGGGQQGFCGTPAYQNGYGGSFLPSVNVNVVTNSGNGVGNTIKTFNRGGGGGPGSVNINVITNSGNGAGNLIKLLNR